MSDYVLGACDCCETEEVPVKQYTRKGTGEPCDPYSLCEICESIYADQEGAGSDMSRNLKALAVVFNLIRKEIAVLKKNLADLSEEMKRKDP